MYEWNKLFSPLRARISFFFCSFVLSSSLSPSIVEVSFLSRDALLLVSLVEGVDSFATDLATTMQVQTRVHEPTPVQTLVYAESIKQVKEQITRREETPNSVPLVLVHQPVEKKDASEPIENLLAPPSSPRTITKKTSKRKTEETKKKKKKTPTKRKKTAARTTVRILPTPSLGPLVVPFQQAPLPCTGQVAPVPLFQTTPPEINPLLRVSAAAADHDPIHVGTLVSILPPSMSTPQVVETLRAPAVNDRTWFPGRGNNRVTPYEYAAVMAARIEELQAGAVSFLPHERALALGRPDLIAQAEFEGDCLFAVIQTDPRLRTRQQAWTLSGLSRPDPLFALAPLIDSLFSLKSEPVPLEPIKSEPIVKPEPVSWY